MSNWKRNHNIYFLCLVISLVIIVIGFVGCAVYTHLFNSYQRTSTTDDPGEYCNFEISPRGGESDQWKKDSVPDTLLYGMVYRGKLSNYSEYSIQSWTLRINIHDTCYINSDWNGKVEIHQQTSSGEKVQTLDLRDYESTDMKLDYIKGDPDLLIPLHEGDYIIYLPSEDSDENTVKAMLKGSDSPVTVLPGFIFYHTTEDPLVFSDLTLSYQLNMHVTQLSAFYIFIVLAALWLLAVIVCIAVQISTYSARKRIEQDALIIEQAINVMTHFVDAKDSYTNGHSCRVANYSRMIGQKLGMDEDKCRQLYYIGLMHDCGKVNMPDSVLKKAGKLTDEEYELIKTHTTRGAELLKGFTSIESVRDGALYHHERFDGKGYPTGKSGEDIPLVGRIICVADSFDAMNSSRCYRSRLDSDYILNELKRNRGTQFDPRIVDCFLELINEGKILIGS